MTPTIFKDHDAARAAYEKDIADITAKLMAAASNRDHYTETVAALSKRRQHVMDTEIARMKKIIREAK